MNRAKINGKSSKYPRVVEDRILVRRDETEDRTKGGILLPDVSREKPGQGVVLGIGPGKYLANGERTEFVVQVGEHIQFGAHSGVEIEHGGETLLVMQEADILVIGD